jgi:undecaprenol kinase
MSMDSKDKNINLVKLFKSFTFALNGMIHVFRTEQNMRIHMIAALITLILAYILSIPKYEVIILLILIGIVISLEMINTSIERIVDLVSSEYHPLAKQAKDVAAGSVLVFSMIAVIIGFLIFLKPLIKIVIP